MLLRRPHELAGLFRDGRRRAGWSQRDLADRIGASRQWVSLVETGKTTIEFDLVLASLQALGYRLLVESPEHETRGDPGPGSLTTSLNHGPAHRTPLTQNGKALGRRARSRRPPKHTESGND